MDCAQLNSPCLEERKAKLSLKRLKTQEQNGLVEMVFC